MLRFAPHVAKPSDLPILGTHLTLHIAFSVSQWVATHVLVSIDQTLTLPSNDLAASQSYIKPGAQFARSGSGINCTYPLNRYSPVRLQESDRTQAECPERLATCSPDDVS